MSYNSTGSSSSHNNGMEGEVVDSRSFGCATYQLEKWTGDESDWISLFSFQASFGLFITHI